MSAPWKIKDVEFHLRRAEDERRAALRAKSDAAAIAHKQLAVEHEAAASATLEAPEVPVFNEGQFLTFAARVLGPAKPRS